MSDRDMSVEIRFYVTKLFDVCKKRERKWTHCKNVCGRENYSFITIYSSCSEELQSSENVFIIYLQIDLIVVWSSKGSTNSMQIREQMNVSFTDVIRFLTFTKKSRSKRAVHSRTTHFNNNNMNNNINIINTTIRPTTITTNHHHNNYNAFLYCYYYYYVNIITIMF